MSKSDYELRFDPKTIEHLGVKMYSTLPPALAELISNAYDADANKVHIKFYEQNSSPKSITITDNGLGMSSLDIQERFLVIGRDRRKIDGDKPSIKFKRLATGKKGLGKLALFGLAKLISIDSTKNKIRNKFVLDWNALLSSNSIYNPDSLIKDQETNRRDGTIIKLSNLKRKTSFDLESIADSISRIFIVDDDFQITLENTNGDLILIENERKYKQLNKQFEWSINDLGHLDGEFSSLVTGYFLTTKTPISPKFGMRGITIFSRGKLVNAPEFFSDSTSSHFYQYLTGSISADFIDLLDEDVISTNRQSINWDHPKMIEFRKYLSSLVSNLNKSWRQKRKKDKDDKFKNDTGIDKNKWLSTLPADMKFSVQKIVNTLNDEEGVDESFSPVVKALHDLVPEYPLLHWRHLHDAMRERIKIYYENEQYGEAADQGTRIFCEHIRKLTGLNLDGVDLTGEAFGGKEPILLVADITTKTGENIQVGQEALSRGLIRGFRNPISHQPIDTLLSKEFSELDCLNILSLVSYLLTRLDSAQSNPGINP